MVKAWLYDTNAQTKSEFDFNRLDMNYDFILLGPAYSETIHPCEYHIVQNLLGAEKHLHVAPYMIRTTKNYVYKVWAKDLFDRSGPGVRFFDATAIFHDKVLLVKYERKTLPDFDFDKVKPYILDTSIPLFYEPAQIYDCEDDHKFSWIQSGESTKDHLVIVEHFSNKVHDLMFTCAYCDKPCMQRKCARCKKVCYCNAECQKKHWSIHKLNCKN